MVSFSYFWNEATCPEDEDKRKYASRLLMHLLPIFIIELIIIIISFYYSSYLSHIFYWPLIAMMSLLCFNMIHMIRNCIFNDLHKSLKYDARWRSNLPQIIHDYESFAEFYSHAHYRKYQNKSCSICLNQFGQEPPDFHPLNKSLLQCGHLFHQSCLQNYERYKWHNQNWPFPFCKCPLCKKGYHTGYEKFNYNPNYLNELPWYYRDYEYPGRLFIAKYLWAPRVIQYRANFKEEWNQYPQTWNTNYFNDS